VRVRWSGTVLLHSSNDRNDPNYPICTQARYRLEHTVDARGRSLQIVDLPLQQQISHINLYIANGVMIVPVAGDPRQDDEQLGILRNLFPEGKLPASVPSLCMRRGAECIALRKRYQEVEGHERMQVLWIEVLWLRLFSQSDPQTSA